MSDKELVNARKRLARALSTIAQSMSDDKTKVNAEFASSSGMSPKIIRNTSGKCCEWCTGLAGQHDYPAKKEVYQRHDNCDCTVEYVVGKKRQNVWSKQVKSEDDNTINRETHGRNLNGLEYLYEKAIELEPSITRDMKEISEIVGSDLYGLEYRIKSKDSYIEKKIKNGSDYEVKDLIRYTFGVDNPDKYVSNYYEIIAELEKRGYTIFEVKNYWNDSYNPYNGINSTIIESNGQKIEIQFHTKESFVAKQEMHTLYEQQRKIKDKYSFEYIELTDKMFGISDRIVVPEGVRVI